MPLFRHAQRYRLIAILFGVELAMSSLLRLVLAAVYRDATTLRALPQIVLFGMVFDVLATLTAFLPLILMVSIFRLRWMRSRTRRVLVSLFAFALCFDVFVQFFFFDEYSARYNHLALDYLMYPDEVFGNIMESYNVPLYAGLALIGAIALTLWAVRRASEDVPLSWRDRVTGAGATGTLAILLWLAWSVVPDAISTNRLTNELARNGWAELIRAYLTAGLDYEAYYALLPADQAAARTARLIDQPDPSRGLVRHFPARAHPTAPRDVIIVMEESLGSIFSKRFGGNTVDPVTPNLDRWSHAGIAFTSVVANGNRTVRGMEGIINSFLSLPGDAIVKRDRSEGLASLPAVLAQQGYETAFFTGGYGLFDNVKPFMLANGVSLFFEQPVYPADAFRTAWGVADEYVFDEMIRQQQRAHASGRPWFAATITNSNHKPFAVPPGRVEWPEEKSDRLGGVLYADWALNRYLTRMQQLGLLDRSVVLVVGDHGSRIYGVQEIPVVSYHVPAIILTPDPEYRNTHVDRLVSHIDLGPTLLSLAGIEYDAPFFGRDVIGLPSDGGRAFVNHNRSIGMLTDGAMVVLQLHRHVAYYTRPDRSPEHFTPAQETPALRELALDAEAAFQTANRVYLDRQYVLPAK
jgi:phosphoglycerol transferase MdoB-like AlkP superfamily enzyme